VSLKAAQAVGGGVLAVDVIEDPERGMLVNEVNHTMEFHTVQPLSGIDIGDTIVGYTVDMATKKG
jgi:[lysine-biosynthesis-protein LysW]--L-2-aminoadipate ligase